ncbi:MAG TPA: ATP-binding cassette domain-containing protein, partial [Tepidisphaeraceae bacterium]|nr:ATP-binding cassette domain-containing protein [Tepidisphaeraceae bacterium]
MHALSFRHLSKTFPGVLALSDVSFDANGGSVHAILGENGAGKSTLLKILSGVHRPSQGEIVLDGRACDFRSTADALNAGIAVIYQELQLVAELSVAENLYLGHLPIRAGCVRRHKLWENARAQLASLGENIDPRTRVAALPIAQRQMIEIAKALTRNARVIAFDEPTSSLSNREVDRLFAVIRQLRDAGRVILYVSHRMEEIYRVCDAATVLRDGRHVQTFADLKLTTADELVNRMVGRSIVDVFGYKPRKTGDEVLSVQNIQGPGLSAPATFNIRRGEILGIFGLVGAGRTELLRLIYGASRTTAGEI